jgi:hypothetical protein
MRTASTPDFFLLSFKLGLIVTSSKVCALTFNHWQDFSLTGGVP